MAEERRYVVLAKAFSAVTHDLNNLLQAVSSTAELMAARADLPEDVRRKSERISLKAQDAAARLERMSALARGGGAAPPRTQNVGAILTEALALRRHDLTHGKVTVRAPSPSPPLFTRAAPGSLDFLLLHLLLEIERAFSGAAGGTLTVSLDPVGDQILLAVAADRPLDLPAQDRPGGGDASGADLGEARRLAEEIGADLSASGDDRSTRFELRLPRVDA